MEVDGQDMRPEHRFEADRLVVRERPDTGMAEDEKPRISSVMGPSACSAFKHRRLTSAKRLSDW
jgi:hypothetical protein